MSNAEALCSFSPFNHYNTEFVKLDANNWQEGLSTALQLLTPDSFDMRAPASDTSDSEQAAYQAPQDSINNKSFTDVTFIVGPPQHSKKYVGHRVLLAMTSPVFETLFYGDMADKNKYIRVPDVAPIGFENLLRYAYTDSLNLGSVEDAMLTAYAAKKYLLPQLLRECLTFIEHNIGPSTACVVYEFAHVLNSQQLVLQAMNLIDRQTNNVITNKSFHHVQASTVEFVANRRYLNLESEYALFDAVVDWATSEAKRRNLDNHDWRVLRNILCENSILPAIRFLAMTQEEFARAIVKTSAITDGSATENTSTAATTGGPSSNGISTGDNNNNNTEETANSKSEKNVVNVEDSNSLLNESEQRAIFLNLIMQSRVARLPPLVNPSTSARQPPPEYFTLRRFRSSAGSSQLVTTTTTTRSIKSISSKFQCLSENVFIVALTVPIRLDVSSSYANRTPKFECHLKFTTKATSSSNHSATVGSPTAEDSPANNHDAGSTLLMDTIDESLHISIARDKDCLVRLKRPILIRLGNINDLTLTFQTYALDEDIVALRTPKLRSANFSEQTDGENVSWLFFRTSSIEFSELHYYY